MSEIDAVLAALEADRPAALARLLEVLRIPSVSAQPAHAIDCARAADWYRGQLSAIGFTAAIHSTSGQPVVLAHHPGRGGTGRPRVLYYGHYDVQPAEPLAEWASPPFEPQIVPDAWGGRIVARGAVDDKGQIATWLEALGAWHRTAGGPPVPVTVLIEGEEEIGSPNLAGFLAANGAVLQADVAVISDTNMWAIDTPALTTRLRGLVYAQIDLRAASRDLHSGLYGGVACNPLNLLCRILADLHDAAGRVQLPGFYDGVPAVSARQAAEWSGLDFNEAAFLGGVGLSGPAGERDVPALNRLWARPTADVNGIWGGYCGEGAKTVIPAEAHAKLSFRLVGDQQPRAVLESLRAFVQTRLPPDVRARVSEFGLASAVSLPADSCFVAAAQTALAEEYGRPAVLMGSGGSIPVVDTMRRVLNLDSLMVGFGLDDDGVHSPNEKFSLRCLTAGARCHARLLQHMATSTT